MKKTIRQNIEIATTVAEIVKLHPKLSRESEVFAFAYNQMAKDISCSSINWDKTRYLTINYEFAISTFSPTRTISIDDNDFNIVLNSYQKLPYVKRVNFAYLTKLVLLYTKNKLENLQQKNVFISHNDTIDLNGIEIIKGIINLLETKTQEAENKINQIKNILIG